MPLISCDGTCATARALRSEVEHLRAQNTGLVDRITNMVDPLLQARLAAAQKRGEARPAAGDPQPPPRASAAYLRRHNQDRPEDAPQAGPTNGEVHASFEG